MLHAAFGHALQHRLDLGMARRCAQFAVNFVGELLAADAAEERNQCQ
jgi:hypothetical protein